MIRQWRLERIVDDGVKAKHQEALRRSVSCFSESVQDSIDKGMVGSELVSDLLSELKTL